jgi:hypothetical protein
MQAWDKGHYDWSTSVASADDLVAPSDPAAGLPPSLGSLLLAAV